MYMPIQSVLILAVLSICTGWFIVHQTNAWYFEQVPEVDLGLSPVSLRQRIAAYAKAASATKSALTAVRVNASSSEALVGPGLSDINAIGTVEEMKKKFGD